MSEIETYRAGSKVLEGDPVFLVSSQFLEAAQVVRDRLVHALAYIRDHRPDQHLEQHIVEALARFAQAAGPAVGGKV